MSIAFSARNVFPTRKNNTPRATVFLRHTKIHTAAPSSKCVWGDWTLRVLSLLPPLLFPSRRSNLCTGGRKTATRPLARYVVAPTHRACGPTRMGQRGKPGAGAAACATSLRCNVHRQGKENRAMPEQAQTHLSQCFYTPTSNLLSVSFFMFVIRLHTQCV